MKDRPRTSLLALRKKPRRNHLRFYCLVTAEAATTLRAGTILPGPQDRRQRSAPVPGRSNAGWHRDVLVCQGLLAFSRCCARGRAHSGLVVHPSVSSVKPKNGDSWEIFRLGSELKRAAGRRSSLQLAPRCGRMAATLFLLAKPVQSGGSGGIQPPDGWAGCKGGTPSRCESRGYAYGRGCQGVKPHETGNPTGAVSLPWRGCCPCNI